jgi:oligopeptide transport system ATP-binding protein
LWTSRDSAELLRVEDLHVHYPLPSSGLVRRGHAVVRAVNGVSLGLNAGETLGLVGESGSGKSTIGSAILRMVSVTAGSITFDGQDITSYSSRQMKPLRRQMQIIYQDPFGSLSPRMRVRDIIAEPLTIHGACRDTGEKYKRVDELLELVGLDRTMGARFPHEFSGGQRQRIGIARGLALSPRLLVCDEPVSALDVSIQAQIINLFVDLKKQLNLSYLFIAHDLAVVRQVCDRIAVMYLGRIVEVADRNELYSRPLHPYTRALLSAVPIADPDADISREAEFVKGEPPSVLNPPSGCAFRTRCPSAMEVCAQIVPPLRSIDRAQVACHLYPAPDRASKSAIGKL